MLFFFIFSISCHAFLCIGLFLFVHFGQSPCFLYFIDLFCDNEIFDKFNISKLGRKDLLR